MDFVHSEVVDPSLYNTASLCGDIPLRRHRNYFKEEIGAIRAQQDWTRLISPLRNFRGGLSAKYGLMQVAVPECKPERLEIISYANEFGFMFDDWTELLNQDELDVAYRQLNISLNESLETGHIKHDGRGPKAMQAIRLQEMLAIDKPRTTFTLKIWKQFLREVAGRQREAESAKTLDAYLPLRVADVGELFWFGLATFGMALTIPEAEIGHIRRITRPCWVALALLNDLFSYEKEVAASKYNGAPYITNAIEVIMKEHSIDLSVAKLLCRKEIELAALKYQRNVREVQHDTTLSRDTKIYLEALMYSISGNAAWFQEAPRYHPGLTFNETQLAMMNGGLERVLGTQTGIVSDDFKLSETGPMNDCGSLNTGL